MTTAAPEQITNKRVQVANGSTPAADRFVSLTTHRLLARTVYVVAVVDGTGRLADDRSFIATPTYERARKHANRLVQQLGKVEPTHYAEHLLPDNRGRAQYGLPRRPKRIAKGPIAYVEPPQRNKYGRWAVAWGVVGDPAEKSRTFTKKPEATTFYNRLLRERSDQ